MVQKLPIIMNIFVIRFVMALFFVETAMGVAQTLSDSVGKHGSITNK